MLGLVLAFRVCASGAASPPLPLPEDPVGGGSVFIEKGCLHCHAIEGYGGSKGPDLGRLQLSGGLLGMAGAMWNHAPKMVAALAKEGRSLPTFSIEEMIQLVAFLYTLNYFDLPGDALAGEDAFTGKRCIFCHRVGGTGGNIGPALDKYGRYVSPIFMATQRWTSGPRMAKTLKRVPTRTS